MGDGKGDSKTWPPQQKKQEILFDRVVSILEQARSNVVRSVNSNTVLAYCLIGREIVEAFQGGEERAEYGKQVIAELSRRLTEKYGKGFSGTNLKYFRTFYQVYADRLGGIGHPVGAPFVVLEKGRPSGDESSNQTKISPNGKKLAVPEKGFHLNLSWSHYRALMRVNNDEAREFYELEAAECGWSKAQLERQIHPPTMSAF